jgi:two-component system, response regulator YesN
MSPYHYILTVKMEKAKEMMAQYDDSPGSAALELGFTDYAHFYRTFRKMEGMSPGQFWKKYRSNLI